MRSAAANARHRSKKTPQASGGNSPSSSGPVSTKPSPVAVRSPDGPRYNAPSQITMPKILLTAFEPYDRWTENASWLALVELTKDVPADVDITTRRYPVDFNVVKDRLAEDLAAQYDYAVHLGQAPGSAVVQLEQMAINAGGHSSQQRHEHRPLSDDGPVAYRSSLPLDAWVPLLRGAGIPTVMSFHAGTYLCNATLYWTHYLAERNGWPTQAVFVHLPLSTSQVAADNHSMASLPTEMSAEAVRLILSQLATSSNLSHG